MRIRRGIVPAVLVLAALAAPAAVQAATPAQANRQVLACMKARGAIRVERQAGHEGLAFFARPLTPRAVGCRGPSPRRPTPTRSSP